MTISVKPSSIFLGFVLGVVLGIASGCGSGSDQRFVPSDEAAVSTLKAALTAWQKGLVPPGRVQESSPAVQLIDTQSRPGQKLASFALLGETTGDARRCYAVRLTMENPREEVRARYVVLGLDPLWVIRYEDFEVVMHWERCLDQPGKASGP